MEKEPYHFYRRSTPFNVLTQREVLTEWTITKREWYKNHYVICFGTHHGECEVDVLIAARRYYSRHLGEMNTLKKICEKDKRYIDAKWFKEPIAEYEGFVKAANILLPHYTGEGNRLELEAWPKELVYQIDVLFGLVALEKVLTEDEQDQVT